MPRKRKRLVRYLRRDLARFLQVERLESRRLLASDFGDAPSPYPTVLADGGAEHDEVGPTLGLTRDSEPDGQADDGADEDGVTFGVVQVGALDATVTVNVQGGSGKLDAWIDFNGDGNWGGEGEQIFDSRSVVAGDNVLTFDVPAYALAGVTYARFRLSTAGELGQGGAAADGEVEDYQVTIDPPAEAAGVFAGQNTISTTAGSARSVQAADVDGDGDLDVLSASTYDEKIAWYENDGSENFTLRTVSTTATGASSVQAADVDGDGDLDVLSASLIDDKIAWYENDGSENFTLRTISTSATGASSVQAADVDGDGDLDLLSASLLDDKIAWYENDGSENFTLRTISASAAGAISVQAADVDGDGDLDVLSASSDDDKIAWYENDGNEIFTLRTISASADFATSVQAADVDGDGDLDVLSASFLDDKIAWYENDGGENFTLHTISSIADGAFSVQAADVDGDGDLDVLSASVYGNEIAWYENDGSENFTLRTISTSAIGARSVQAADVDGDGDLDVLSASFLDDKIAWYENVDVNDDFGDAPAPYPTTLADDGAFHDAVGPTLGATRDVEADGQADDGADEDGVTFGVVQVGALDAAVMVNVQGGSGKLDAWIDFNGDGNWGGEGEQIFDSRSVVAGDNVLTFDVPAYALAGVTYARFRLSTAGELGQGGAAADGEVEDYQVTIDPPAETTALFSQNTISTSADGAVRVQAADIDGDGDLDVLSASVTDNKIAWYENDGSEIFTLRTISTSVSGAQTVQAADVDGDGDLDVLSASVYDDKIAWYENDGSENFTLRTISTSADGAVSVQAADVDGDGDLDVLSASASDDKIAWYENDGSENFTLRTISISADIVSSVQAADVDGDGDLDVLSASRFDNKIAWYENDGSENFTLHTISTTAAGARSVQAADVDGDGDLDVLSVSFFDDKIAWYENVNADFGDAPAPYPTTLADDGAFHDGVGPRLGATRDAEPDGQTDDGADEDGVTFGTINVSAVFAGINLNVQNASSARVDAWIDFDGDGTWDPSEQILDDAAVFAGLQTLNFQVPATADIGNTYARVRLSSAGNLEPTGFAADGEVEDYVVNIVQDAEVNLSSAANDVTVRRNGANVEVVDNNDGGAVLTSVPITSTQSLTINGNINDDKVTVDYSSGFFSLPDGIAIHGATSNDQLIINGSGTEWATYHGEGGTLGNAHVSVQQGLQTSTIAFTGFEPLDVTGVLTFGVDGTLNVGAEALTIDSTLMAGLDGLTLISGGTINSTSGLALGSAESIVGHGAINAAFSGQSGSTISLTGDLSIGDATAVNGFHTDGILQVNQHTATLLDANQAVLGSLTSLGSGGSTGTVTAANGALVDFGRNLTGFGTLDTPNDITKLAMINGAVIGTSGAQAITLSGYVKGVGSLDNATTTGTYSPGFSPAQVVNGNVAYGATGTTLIELGGTTAGSSGYDQLIHTGTASLGGDLTVQLIDGFVPVDGDSFVIMTADTAVQGTFTTLSLPTLPQGLGWDVTYDANEVRLTALTLPDVESVVINAGGIPDTRSHITSVTVTFAEGVDHAALELAFTLTNITTDTQVGMIHVAASDSGGKTVAVLTFEGASTITPLLGTLERSLADGNYRLNILSGQVQNAAGNGVTMDEDYEFGGQLNGEANNDEFFRWYGDVNGDGATNFTDFANGFLPAFASTIDGTPQQYREDLDLNGDGAVNFTDFANGFLPKFASSRP